MIRQLLWVAAVVAVIAVAFGIKDHREAERRRELWAEATD